MSSIVDFDCLTLAELERMAFQTNNVLALAIFARAEQWAADQYEVGFDDAESLHEPQEVEPAA